MNLITPRKQFLIIFYKPIEIVLYRVRWIDKNEITFQRFVYCSFKVRDLDIKALKPIR